jgi:hypothetical protein
MPFAQAAALLSALTGIEVSQALAQRYSEAAGAAYEQGQTESVACIEQGEIPVGGAVAQKLQFSADGAMVPLLHGQWAEVRTLVIGEVQPAVQRQDEWIVQTRKLSYFSRKVSAQEFERLALVEMVRRGVEQAAQVGAVMDGADWEQGFIDYHRPDAVRILDFAHAAEHISPVGELLWGEGTAETHQWLSERLHELKHAGPQGILAELRALQKQYPDEKVVVGNLAYFEKREAQLHYPQFQAAGWPIGSGMVESGNKIVVEARLKGAGMHWAGEHVNPMLALRNILCSERWDEEWPKVEARLRQQAAQRRRDLHQRRQKDQAALAPPTGSTAPDPVEERPNLVVVDPRWLDLPKPPKSNSWGKFTFGRALYQRPDPPKN